MVWNFADFETLPLNAGECKARELPVGLEKHFPRARDGQAALAGLLLLYGHWEECHQIAQDVLTREGSYWHAIAHRIEPDSWNAGYWFRRVGEHPIFDTLYKDAKAVLADSKTGWRLKEKWDAGLFIEWCDEARGKAGSEKERVARQIQRLECEHLFAWCAGELT